MEYDTYIKVCKATKAPHLLPKFIPNRLVMQEIAYQTLVYGVGAALNRDKKMIWPPLSLWVGACSFKDVKVAQAEADTLASFHFGKETFYRYNPLRIISTHCHNCKYRWSYESEA
jgi:hypothetical protein